MSYNRTYQESLQLRIARNDYASDTSLLEHILQWLDSDTACKCLEDFCTDYEIDISDLQESPRYR